MIEFPVGAVKFTGWQDVRDKSITGTVASPLPATKRSAPVYYTIYGGSHAVELRVSPQTLQEGVGEQMLTVTAQNAIGETLAEDLVIPLVFTDISTSSSDYSVRGPPSVTIPAGKTEGSATVHFTPADDLVREARVETVRIEGSKGAMMTPLVRGAELRLLDAAGIRLSASPGAVTEGGGAQQVTVTAEWGDAGDSALARDVEVSLAWGGTAGSSDYVRSGGTTVTIPANARSGSTTVTITPTDDKLLEGDETITISGSTPGRAVAQTEMTLTDDETVPAVSIAVDTNAVQEGGSAQTVTVSATLDPVVAMANDVTTVTLGLGGTATGGGTDYTSSWSPSTPEITIPVNATEGSNTVSLTLTPVDDQSAEGDETIVVQGTATTESRTLVVKVATIALEDDDEPGVNVSPGTLTVAEGATGTYEVWLGTRPASDVTVSLSSTDGTVATVNKSELTFTPTTWDTRQEVTLTGEEDDRNNADDRRIATIRHTAGGGGYDDVEAAEVSVIVTDDDEAASFSIGDASVTEGQTASFTVTRRGATGDAATVAWSTAEDADGDHLASSADYTAQTAAQTLSFAGGETSKTITVRTAQDTLDEDDETFLVVLSSPSTGTSIADGTATGTIIDDDETTAELSIAAPAAVSEGAADATATMSFAVNLSAASGRRVTVDYADAGGGTATSGTDYSSVTAGTLTFAAGETSKTVAVTVNGDDVDEDNETVTLRLSSPVNAGFAAGATTLDATGTITDDDTRGVTVSAASGGVSVAEADDSRTSGTKENEASYTVALTSEPTGTVTIELESGNTRVATVSPSSLEFTASDWGAKTVTVTGVSDDVDNANDRRTTSITHTVDAVGTDYEDETAPGVPVTVTDDEATPTVALSLDPASIAESGNGNASTVTAALDRASHAAVTVMVSVPDGAPVTQTGTTLTIAAGATASTGTVTLTAVDNNVDAPAAAVTVSGDADGGGVADPADVTLAITDDDAAPTGITLTTDTPTIAEDAATKTVKVTATVNGDTTYATDTTVRVMVGASNDSATSETDYAAVTAFDIDIDAGEMSGEKTFRLDPTDDAIDEDSESISVSGTSGTLTVTGTNIALTDNDTRRVTVTGGPLMLAEADTSGTPAEEHKATYTVVLDSEPTDDVTINIGVPEGAPFTVSDTGLDFTPSTWSTAQEVTVTAVDDNVDNTGDMRRAVISHTVDADDTDYEDETAPDVTVTVTDDDAAPTALTLTVDADTETDNVQTSVSEGGGVKTVRVTATLDGSTTFATDKTVTVEVGKSSDGAAEGTDYAMVGTQSVTIKAGASSGHADFTLTPTADSLHEGPETISVEGALSGVTVAGAEITITDDDAAPTTATLAVDADTGTGNVQTSLAEGGGAKTARVTATLGGSSTFTEAKTVTVEVGHAGDGATEGTDYAMVGRQEIEIAAGASSGHADFTLTPTDDAVDEESETISFKGTADGLTVADAVITLTDDDTKGVTVSAASAGLAIRETDDGGTTETTESVATYTVVLASEPTGDVVIDVEVPEGAPFTASPSSLTFTPSGAGIWSSPQVVTVTAVDDNVDNTGNARSAEITHTLTVGRSDYGGVSVPAVTVTVSDDDAAPSGITLTTDTPTIAEDAATKMVKVTATVNGDTTYAEAKTVRVTVGTNGDSATSGDDYATVTAFDIEIEAGEMSGEQTFSLNPADDAIDEDSESIRVSGTSGNIEITDASIEITDNDTRGVTVTGSPLTMLEADNPATNSTREDQATYTVVLDSEPTDDVTINIGVPEGAPFTVSDTGLDFTPSTWSTAQTVTVTAVDDNVDNTGDMRSAVISHTVDADGTDYEDETAPDVTVTVTDDDAAPTALTLTVDADTGTDNVQTSVSEGGGAKTVRVTATLDGSTTFAVDKTVTVEVGHADDSATEGTDYAMVVTQTITLKAGASSGHVDFTLTPANDDVDEENETISFKGTAAGLTVADAEITLTDDDTKGVTVSAASAGLTVRETDDAGTTETTENVATYTVVLTSQPTDDVVIDVEVPAGAPFTASPSSLTFTPDGAGIWSTAQRVTVTAVDDNVDNTGNRRSASITHAPTVGSSDYGGLSVPDVTVTVTDDDAAPTALTLTVDADTGADNVQSSVSEGGGAKTVRVTATLGGSTTFATDKTVTVEVGHADDSATEGADYAMVGTQSITIKAGASSAHADFALTPTDDSLHEGSETISFKGTAAGLTVADATITITDDDAAPTALTLTVDADTGTSNVQNSLAEDGGAKTVRVTATLGGSSTFVEDKTVTVEVGNSGDSAAEGTDYAMVATQTITLKAGASSGHADFTLTPTDDAVDEESETISFKGTATGLTVADATITLTDDDTKGATVSAAAAGLTIRETDDGSTAQDEEHKGTYTIVLDSQPTGAVVVNISVPAGAPFTASPSRLTFTPGGAGIWSTAQRVTVTAVDDNVDNTGNARSASITHALTVGRSDYGGVSVPDVTVTVTDDDAAPTALTLTVDADTETDNVQTSVSEGGGAKTVRVTATLGGSTTFATDKTVTVEVGKSSDSATEGTDYARVATQTITIGAGASSGHADFTLTPTDDAVDEENETISLDGTLAGVTVTDAVITLTDDDDAPGGIALSVDTDSVTADSQMEVGEAAGATTVTVTATVTGSTTYSGAQTVAVSVSGGTATVTDDFAAVPGFNITIPAGTASARGAFTLTPVADAIDEDDETVDVTGTVAGDGAPAVTGATITLTDDDTKGVTVSAASAGLTIRETDDAGTPATENVGTYTVVLASEPTDDVVIDVEVPAGAPFTASPSRLTFTPGGAGIWSTAQVVTVTAVDDNVDNTGGERSASITHSLTVGRSDYGGVSVPDVTVTVTDDDGAPGGIALSVDTDSVMGGEQTNVGEEAGATTVTVTATVTGGTTYGVAQTVAVTVSSGTATVTDDFAAVTGFNITIPAGATARAGTFTLTPVNDLIHEGNESINVRGAVSGDGAPTVSAAAVTITDDDASPTGLTLTVDADTDTPAAQTSVSEGGGAKTVRVTATLDGSTTFATDKTVTVEVGKSSDSATEGTDYTMVGTQTITLKAGASSGHADFTLTPTDDLLFEGGETISLDGTLAGVTVTDATITLTDDETLPAVTLLVDPDAVSESGGTRAVTVSAVLDPTVAMANDTTTVTLSLGGTATAGTDYTSSWSPSTPVITFPVGETKGANTVTLTLTPTDDSSAEEDETVVVQGTATTQSRSLVVKIAVITLEDDDAPGVNLSPRSLTVTEGAAATYDVWLGTQPSQDVTVTLSGLDATMATADRGSLTFTQTTWNIRQQVTVSGEEDDLDNAGDKRVTSIRHSAAGGGYDNVDDAVLNVTVADNDDAPSFSIGDALAAEGDAVTFTVNRAGAKGAVATVSWQTTDDTDGSHPASTADYTAQATAQVLSFAAGDTSKTLTVQTTEDMLHEEDETFLVKLSAPSAGALIDDGTATGTITDDDGAPTTATLAVDADTGTQNIQNSLAEDGGAKTVRVTATLGGSVTFTEDKTVTVEVGNSGDTATEGTDYQTVGPQSITITAGSSTGYKDFTLTPIQDQLAEGDETISFKGTAAGLTVADAEITLTDDDSAPTTATLAVDADTGTGNVQNSLAEDGGAKVVRVTATLGGSVTFTADKTVTVEVGDDDDSAAEGTDYATVGTQTVTIKAGASSGHVDFTLTPTQDQLAEGSETISFEGTATGLTVADAEITLTDDDSAPTTATLAVDADTGTQNTQNSLAEDGGAKTVRVTATLGGSVTFAVDKTVTVEVGHADDSATEGTDYAMVGTQSITITAGTSSGHVDFTLTPTADLLHEGDETISVEGALSGVSVTSATITITDDDAARMITVLLSASDYEVFEGESLTVKVNLSESRAADTVIALDPATRTGQTATRGVDYDGSMRTVTILAGETSGTARISTTADDRKDPNETFTVAIQESGLSGDVILGEPHTAVVTIRERVAGVTPPATATVEYKGSDSRITLTVPADLQGNGIDVAFRYGTDKGTARSGGFRCGDDDDADLINREVVGSGTPGEVINRPTLRRMMDLDADTVDLEIELCPGSRGKTFDVIWDTTLYLGNPDRGFPGIRSAPFDAAAAHCSSASLCWTRVTIEGGDAVEACVSHSLRETVEFHAGEAHHGDAHVDRWKQVLAAFGDDNGHTAMTAAEAQQNANQFQASRWNPVVTALQCLEAAPAAEDSSVPAGPEATILGGGDIAEGADAVFTVHADPAPASDLTVALAIADDTASDFLAENDEGPKTVTIKAGESSAAYTLTTVDDDVEEADGSVSAMIEAGTGYRVGTPSKVVVAVSDDDDPAPVAPVVNIAGGAGVTEGAPASFTVTANPAPGTPLTVALTIDQSGDYAATGETGVREVVVPTEGSMTFEVATVNDTADEPDGSVTATLAAGAGYAVAASPDDAASVAVADDDVAAGVPSFSVDDAEAKESDFMLRYTLRLSPASGRTVSVWVHTRESDPVSARDGEDYVGMGWGTRIVFRPGTTERELGITLINDSHDEGSETFEVELLAPQGGATIADGVGVMTIVNDDPMPAAFLARFGRTVAEQALDGIAGRIAAPRGAGARGTIAGQALNLGTGSGADGAANDAGSLSMAANDNAPLGGVSRGVSLAQSDVARAFGASADRPGSVPGQAFGGGYGPDDTHGLGQSRTMTGLEALLGSSFTATGETDSSGGSLAFWGRAAQSSFDGREGAFSLDGETTTAMLGADYARGNWLVGLALMQSSGEGGYADAGTGSVRCPQDLDAETRAVLCAGAIREGDGDVEASLTAVVPYAAIQASERLRLWGAAGYGAGEVTLKPEPGGSLKSDISWTMAAAGARSELLPPPKEGSGTTLALTADALWARTSSEKTHELAASDSDVTRLRLGLEGGYAIATEGGGRIVPRVEIGARHDGGDAETGFGVELGGGIAWTDPAIGLSLDLSGRTLIAHGNDDLEDQGFAASLAFDPNPGTERGLSLTLRQDWGGSAQGGLDTLFATDPLADRSGTAEATSRWQAEAAYGFPAFSGRYVGSPHVGFGLATGARDYSLGWRLSPAANANAPDLSFGLKATRRESEGVELEHTVGFELRANW